VSKAVREMSSQVRLCCIHESCRHIPLTIGSTAAECANGHVFHFAPNTKIPVFQTLSEGASEYSIIDAAIKHDNAFKWLYQTFQTNEKELRQGLVDRLSLRPGMKVLIVGAGSCEDLPFIVSALGGQGEIHCQDISAHMLLEGEKRHGRSVGGTEITLTFSVSDVKSLPFQDQTFDIAYHFGGVNVFGDIRRGLSEINRVVVDGGKVLISDEGIAPWLQNTEFGRMMTANNPLYGSVVPIDSLPDAVTQAEISWILQGCFYVIEFQSSHKQIKVDIDVPHVGTRGGSIRTRYYGVLEGISPEIKTKIYTEAERRNLSRVELLEKLLLQGLDTLPRADTDVE
jgi:ubiquinone/menaquinone biosynthesis C-methylase UbiE